MQTSGNSGAYRLYPDGRLIIDQIPTTAGNATAFETTAGANMPYCIGYASGADVHSSSRYSNFQGVVQSQFYQAGTKTNKATYSLLEAVIAKPATSGNLRIGYRSDLSSSFTTLATYAADGSATTFRTDIGLIDIENIQIQAEIDGAAAPTMELVEIRLIP